MNDCESIEKILRGTLSIIEGMLDRSDEQTAQVRSKLAQEREQAANALDERVKLEVTKVTETLKRQTAAATGEATKLQRELAALNKAYQPELDAHKVTQKALEQCELERQEMSHRSSVRLGALMAVQNAIYSKAEQCDKLATIRDAVERFRGTAE